jgi:photosystem I reaction center subunit VIII
MAPVLLTAILLIGVGIITTVLVPAVGWVVPLLGIALLIAYLFGLGKKAAEPPA